MKYKIDTTEFILPERFAQPMAEDTLALESKPSVGPRAVIMIPKEVIE